MDLRRALKRVLIAAACAWAAACFAAPPGVPSDERQVKAAVVFNLLQFVQWPAGSLPPERPVTLCVSENGRATHPLERYDGTPVRGTTLSLRAVPRHMERLAGCHAVFVEAGDPHLLLRVAAASRQQAIMVIAEGDQVLQQGADIGLSVAGGRVVFDIDLGALRAAGFAVSSKLLRLARSVVE